METILAEIRAEHTALMADVAEGEAGTDEYTADVFVQNIGEAVEDWWDFHGTDRSLLIMIAANAIAGIQRYDRQSTDVKE